MGVWTNVGLTLAATALQTTAAQTAITYVGVGSGAGTLASAITAGVAVTSLALDAGVPVALASGQSLTVSDGTNSETVTTSGAVSPGATSIPITSWTPVNSYAAHTSGVAPTPLISDTALYNETARIAANTGSAGANPGESLNAAYFDGTQASGFYMQVGFFGGSTATSAVNTGTLVFEDIQVWSHTVNADSNIYQADSQI